jgi:hypothetical protein
MGNSDQGHERKAVVMKNLIRSICVWLIILSGIGTLNAADLKDEFMGTKWKTDLSASTKFLKLDEKDEISNYVNPSVVHTFGDIKIYQVIYSCYSNKFFAVFIQIDTYEIFNQMKDHISEKYGRSKMTIKINPDRTIHTWKHHGTKIKLKLNEETGNMKLAFYYTPLSAKVNEERLEQYQESTKGFLKNIDKERAVETLDLMKF